MARPTNKIENLNSECIVYRKLAEKVLGDNDVKKTKQVEIAKQSLVVAANNIISVFYMELVHAYYVEAEMDMPEGERSEYALNHWLNSYDLPFSIESYEAYTPLVCLCLSLEMDLLDISDFTGFDYNLAENKKSSYQKLIESSYQDLLVPVYMLSLADSFSLLYLKAKDLVESGGNAHEYESIVAELTSTLESIREIAELLDPITGLYLKVLAEKKKSISKERSKSAQKRHDKNIPLYEAEMLELETVFKLMFEYLKADEEPKSYVGVINACVLFVNGCYYVKDLATKTKMLAGIESFKAFKPNSSHKTTLRLAKRVLDKADSTVYKQLFTQVSRRFYKERAECQKVYTFKKS